MHSFSFLCHNLGWFLVFLNFVSVVLCHDYIRSWSPDGGKTFEKGHKQPLAKTAVRDVSENTGWIGSQFLTNPAIVCGSSLTPSEKVAAPGGQMFSEASASAGKTLAVEPGSAIHIIFSDEPGKIFPHDVGHIQTYLGYCGESQTACQDFNAASTPYFKIQSEIDALASKTKFPYNKSRDGNEWVIPIPINLPGGSYILRSEIIALEQSTEKEGKQDQYYVTCGQISLPAPTSSPINLAEIESVRFPGAYTNGKLDRQSKRLPGPDVLNFTATREVANFKSAERTTVDVSPKRPVETPVATQAVGADQLAFDASSPECANTCLSQKLKLTPEKLAPECGIQKDAECLCANKGFLQAFINCARDQCQVICEAESVINEMHAKCGQPTRIHCGPQRLK